MWQSLKDGIQYVRTMAMIASVFWTAVFAPVALMAQAQHDRAGSSDANESCIVRYERFAIAAYIKLDRCIQSTNRDPWYSRAVSRAFCNAEYISDAIQAESEYVSCMSFENIWPK